MAEPIIVITTDLSIQSTKAFQVGAEQAKHVNGKAVVLSIATPFELPIILQQQLADADSLQNMKDTYEADQVTRVEEFLQKNGADSSLEVALVFSEESPSTAITQYAKEHKVAMIVMASQGEDSLNKWLVGSTAHQVINTGTCPVLIVPHDHEESES